MPRVWMFDSISSHSKFQYHKCKSKAEQHYDIDQKESTSSVSTHNVWKSPDIAYSYSYRRTNSCKNKAKIRIPLFPTLLRSSFLFSHFNRSLSISNSNTVC